LESGNIQCKNKAFGEKKKTKTSKHVTFTSYQFKVGKEAKSLLLFLMQGI